MQVTVLVYLYSCAADGKQLDGSQKLSHHRLLASTSDNHSGSHGAGGFAIGGHRGSRLCLAECLIEPVERGSLADWLSPTTLMPGVTVDANERDISRSRTP